MIDPLNPNFANTPASPTRPVFEYSPADSCADPCISIITPFFNEGDLFQETVLSVLRQSLQQWEWIIVNDGSTDCSANNFLQLHIDSRIRIINHSENKGPSAARNTGFLAARSPYAALLDSDDLLEPTALEKWIWFLETHPECAFVSGYSIGFGAAQYLDFDGFFSGREILRKNTARVTAAVRKQTHTTVGGYREDMRGGFEDWEFWLRCANHGFWGDTIPEHLDWYRRRKDHSDRWKNYGLTDNEKNERLQIQSQYAHLTNAFPMCTSKPLEIYPRISENIPFNNLLRKSKRRLLMIIPWMTMGGADKFNLDLVSQLSKNGWETTIVATLPGDNCWFPQLAQITPDIFILDHFLPLADWPRFICYLVSSRQIDHILISNSDFGYSILPYLKHRFSNIVFTDFCHMEEEYWKGGGYPRKGAESQPLLDMNIVSSKHLKEWMIQRGAQADRISVCYTNIDSTEWHPRPEQRDIIRKEFEIRQDIPLLLYAGRIHSQKQPRVFAETILRLKNNGLAFMAIVAGDGPEFQWLQKYCAEHQLQSHIKLLGAVPNSQLKRILQGADIFFLPSRMEGISLAIYEAMACGVVVVGADVGGQKELVTPDCGCLISKNSESAEAETYAAVISRLLREPKIVQAMGANGRKRIEDGFELQVMGRRMHELLLLAADWSRNLPRLPVNPGLGQSLVAIAIDYHRIEKLLQNIWPSYLWTQRNRSRLEPMFPDDTMPLSPMYISLNRVQQQLNSDRDNKDLSSMQLFADSIYNLFANLPERVLHAYLDSEIPAQSILLKDLLAMRRRILPEIQRWQHQKSRITIYGVGTHTQVLLGTLPILMPLVHGFIDQVDRGVFLGKRCIQPADVHPGNTDVVIYSSKRWEQEMYQNLSHLTSIEHILIYGDSSVCSSAS